MVTGSMTENPIVVNSIFPQFLRGYRLEILLPVLILPAVLILVVLSAHSRYLTGSPNTGGLVHSILPTILILVVLSTHVGRGARAVRLHGTHFLTSTYM